jgi:hypothetical protein
MRKSILRDRGDYCILGLRRRRTPILHVRAQDAPSAHFMEIDIVTLLSDYRRVLDW